MSILVSDGAGPVAVSVSKNSSHSASTSDVDGAASFMISRSDGYDASNLPSSNNTEEPLSLELHSAPVPTEVSVSHNIVTWIHVCNYVYAIALTGPELIVSCMRVI